MESLSPPTFPPSFICYAKPLLSGHTILRGLRLRDHTPDVMYLTWESQQKKESPSHKGVSGDEGSALRTLEGKYAKQVPICLFSTSHFLLP